MLNATRTFETPQEEVEQKRLLEEEDGNQIEVIASFRMKSAMKKGLRLFV